MKASISNAKVSKSGKSINFNYSGEWYSLKIKNATERVANFKNAESLNGLKIVINSYNLSGGWVMIRDFSIDGVTKAKKVVKSSSADVILIPHRSNRWGGGFHSLEEEEIAIHKFDLFSPFELLNTRYANSNTNDSFIVSYLHNLKKINKKMNGYASVIQNIIARGKNVKTFTKKPHSLIALLILESFKRGYGTEKCFLNVPLGLKQYIDDSINELKELNEIFLTITKSGFGKELDKFINSFVIKTVKHNAIQLVNDNDVHMEIELTKRLSKDSTPTFLDFKDLEYKDLSKHLVSVNKLLKLCFYNSVTKISKLKKEQASALVKLMNEKQNILAVLKTGFGKSLIYQFASLLQPKIFLNVFPINSLIKDQSISLKKEFKFDFVFDNEELKATKQKDYHKKLLSNKRMFLVTPERLQNRGIQEYFMSLHKMIGYMIFDEAHCISEWGHDFRPSYLMARYLMESLIDKDNIKVIALTATAAPHIQKDVAKLLSIDFKNIINIADSSGLQRDEITFDIIEKEFNDFDQWNRSETFAQEVDSHIANAREKSKQGIAFFMRSGSISDMEKNKYLIKSNAYSTFQRLDDRKDVGLYTGNNKHIEYDDQNLSNLHFDKYLNIPFIIATKSFGMGISLKKCDYVLLSEPPYSLEDLYQQSGRVGRLGQKSLVEILYHERSLIDPLSSESPYKFFLKINEKRQEEQVVMINILIKNIIKFKKGFMINTFEAFDGYNDDKQNNLLWSIAHLMTEFKLIKKYYVEYGKNFKMKHIYVYPTEITDKQQILDIINKRNDELELGDKSTDIFNATSIFYKYYFNKLQNDKIIGINILRSKIGETDTTGADDSALIYNALNEYYKTRTDEVDLLTSDIMDKLVEGIGTEEMVNFIQEKVPKKNAFEIIEAISRYSISNEFILIGSLLMNRIFGEKILISNLENILTNKYNQDNLEDIKNHYILEILNTHETEDEIQFVEVIKKNKDWKEMWKLTAKLNILRSLNG